MAVQTVKWNITAIWNPEKCAIKLCLVHKVLTVGNNNMATTVKI
jgi:hypothetical protein